MSKLSFSWLHSGNVSMNPRFLDKMWNWLIALSEKKGETYFKLIKWVCKDFYFFSASPANIIINAFWLRTWELHTIIEPRGVRFMNFSTNRTCKLVQSLWSLSMPVLVIVSSFQKAASIISAAKHSLKLFRLSILSFLWMSIFFNWSVCNTYQ